MKSRAMRSRLVTARAAILLAVLVLLVPGWLPAGHADGAPARDGDRPVTIFFVRHAEKASEDARDPELSESGRRRADDLAELLAQIEVTHLFATEFKRTRQTLLPLSKASGREVTVVPAGDGAAQVRALRELPEGSVAVVAGHSNTIPGLACDVGGPAKGLDCVSRKLPDEQYDRLFVVVDPPTGRPRTLTLRYGD